MLIEESNIKNNESSENILKDSKKFKLFKSNKDSTLTKKKSEDEISDQLEVSNKSLEFDSNNTVNIGSDFVINSLCDEEDLENQNESNIIKKCKKRKRSDDLNNEYEDLETVELSSNGKPEFQPKQEMKEEDLDTTEFVAVIEENEATFLLDVDGDALHNNNFPKRNEEIGSKTTDITSSNDLEVVNFIFDQPQMNNFTHDNSNTNQNLDMFKVEYENSQLCKQEDVSSEIINAENISSWLPVNLCPVCHKPCNSKAEYEVHMFKHKDKSCTQEGYICLICRTKFLQRRDAKKHVSRFHKMNEKNKHLARTMIRGQGLFFYPYTCCFCNTKMVSNTAARNHVIMKHEIDADDYEQNRQSYVLYDMSGMKTVGRFKCELCSKKAMRRATIISHLQDDHSMHIDNYDLYVTKIEPDSSMQAYSQQSALHQQIISDIEHMEYIDDTASGSQVEQQQYQQAFNDIENLQEVQSIQMDEQSGFIPEENIQDLENNEIITVRPLLCHICNKTSSSELEFRKHLIKHSSKDQYQSGFACIVCKNKTFVRRVAAQNHVIRKHGIDRSEKNQYIVATLIQGRGLNFYPFTCLICHVKLMTLSSVRYHVLNQHNIAPEDYERDRKKYMKDESKRLQKIGKFRCKICDKRALNRDTIVTHCVKQHDVQRSVMKEDYSRFLEPVKNVNLSDLVDIENKDDSSLSPEEKNLRELEIKRIHGVKPNKYKKPVGPFSCKLCPQSNEEFVKLKYARFHVIHVHEIEEREYRINRHKYLTNIDPVRREICHVCLEPVRNLKHHMNMKHLRKLIFKCKFCPQRYDRHHILQKHVKEVIKLKNFFSYCSLEIISFILPEMN